MNPRNSVSCRLCLFSCIIAILMITAPSAAQTDPALEEGLKPFGSFHGGNIDSVNTTTGKLEVHIPLISFPQRGSRLRLNY